MSFFFSIVRHHHLSLDFGYTSTELCMFQYFFFALSLLQTDSMTIFRCVFVSLSLSRCVSLIWLSRWPSVSFRLFWNPPTLFFPFFLRFRRNRRKLPLGSLLFFFLCWENRKHTTNTIAMLSFFFRERIYFSLFCWKKLSVQTTLAIFFSSASLFFNDCPLGPCMGLFYLPYFIRQSVLSSKHTFFS